MAKSTRWSMKDIRKVKRILKQAKLNGQTEAEGLAFAAKAFGVTLNALRCRLWKLKRNINMTNLENKTSKTPLIRKKKYSKKAIANFPVIHNVYPVVKEITFDIRDVKIDMVNKKITFIY